MNEKIEIVRIEKDGESYLRLIETLESHNITIDYANFKTIEELFNAFNMAFDMLNYGDDTEANFDPKDTDRLEVKIDGITKIIIRDRSLDS